MAGMKNDRKDGKPRWELLPLPLLEQIVNVYTFGAQKYAENSWQDLPDGFRRYKAAMIRHLVAFEKGEITDKEIIPLLDYVLSNYQLSQKDIIALGLVAQHGKILSTEMTRQLQLQETDRMRSYVDRLLKNGILITRGIKKGTEFLLNPQLITNAKLNIKTSLKTIEPHSLEALIKEDLRLHPHSKIKEINGRLPDVEIRDIRKLVYAMVRKGLLEKEGSKTDRTYTLS